MFWTDFYLPPLYDKELTVPEIDDLLKAFGFLKEKCTTLDTSVPVNYLETLKTKIESSEPYKAADADKASIRMKHDSPPKEEVERRKKAAEEKKLQRQDVKLDAELVAANKRKSGKSLTREERTMKKRQREATHNLPDEEYEERF